MADVVTYTRPFDVEDMKIAVQKIISESDSSIEQSEIDEMIEYSSNIIGLFRIFLRDYIVNNASPKSYSSITDNRNVAHYYNSVWNSLTGETQANLLQNSAYTNEHLKSTGLKTDQSKLILTDFKDYIDQFREENTDPIALHASLTWQELELLELLQENREKSFSRDDIAKKLWKNEWTEKYSDWAIAQLVSQLRKKTSSDPLIIIKTVPKEGFTLLDR